MTPTLLRLDFPLFLTSYGVLLSEDRDELILFSVAWASIQFYIVMVGFYGLPLDLAEFHLFQTHKIKLLLLNESFVQFDRPRLILAPLIS